MMYEGIVRRGNIVVHAPIIRRSDGQYVNLNTGLVEIVLSCEPMSRERSRHWRNAEVRP